MTTSSRASQSGISEDRLKEVNRLVGQVIARATELMGITGLPRREKSEFFEPNIKRWISVIRGELHRGILLKELLDQLDDYDREKGSLHGAVPWRVFCCNMPIDKIKRRRWAIGTKADDAHDQVKRDRRREEYRPPPPRKPTELDIILGAMSSKGHAGFAAELRSVITTCRNQKADAPELRRRVAVVCDRRKVKLDQKDIDRLIEAAEAG